MKFDPSLPLPEHATNADVLARADWLLGQKVACGRFCVREQLPRGVSDARNERKD